MSAHFELVRSDAGHFARFIAGNGREVWRTLETYTRRRGAERAVGLIGGPITHSPFVTGAQPDEPASQAGRPVAGGAG